MKKHFYTIILAALLSMPLLLKAQTPVSITFAVNDSAIGAINPPPGTHTFSEGDEFSIAATAVDGYRIMGWVITGELDGEPFYTPLRRSPTHLRRALVATLSPQGRRTRLQVAAGDALAHKTSNP